MQRCNLTNILTQNLHSEQTQDCQSGLHNVVKWMEVLMKKVKIVKFWYKKFKAEKNVKTFDFPFSVGQTNDVKMLFLPEVKLFKT